MRKVILVLFVFMAIVKCYCQTPQWKFPIAFEDATGAKDTVFFIWDSTANFYVDDFDTVWGEIPMSIDSSKFCVYLQINLGYFAKTWAIPPDIGFERHVFAINYIYPIKISWDTALFHSSSIDSSVKCAEMDNDYFFWTSGTSCQKFNMFSNDTVMAPAFWWGSQDQFPLFVRITSYSNSCCGNAIEETQNEINDFNIYPNPFGREILVESYNRNIKEIIIFSPDGRIVSSYNNNLNSINKIHLSLKSISQGVYIMKIINNKNKNFYKKIIKGFD